MFKLIKKNFSLDLRSLALFRVGIAVILLIDFLWTRLPYFDLFYTNKGLLPLQQLMGSNSFWATTSSLNFVSSSSPYQIFLFIMALLCFTMLLLGYKTRWALLGSWLLMVSFHSRNFLILNSGDTLFCLILFWALRLPLGEYFSLDSVLKGKRERAVFSVNSLALIFQLLFVYYFTYLLKTDHIWKSGQGVYYSLMLDNFRTVWGDILLQYPGLMKVLSIVTYYMIESFVPFAFIFFGFVGSFRIFLILMMCGFHFSLGMFLHLGLFSWICMVGWLAFLPAEFWDGLNRWLERRQKGITVYYDGACSFCRKMVFLAREFLILPHLVFQEAQSNKKALSEMEKRNSWLVWDPGGVWHDRWQAGVLLVSRSSLFFWLAPLLRGKVVARWGNILYEKVAKNRQSLGHCLKWIKAPPLPQEPSFPRKRESLLSLITAGFFLLCFIYALMWNIRTLNFDYYSRFMPRSWNGPGAFFHLHQYWNMFAPKPLDTTGWLILSAEPAVAEKEGERIDLWQGGQPVVWNKPERYDMTFPVFRLRKMMENLVLDHKRYSGNYLEWLCRKWNKKNRKRQVKKIHFIYMRQKVPPPGQAFPPAEKTTIRKKTCP